MADRAHSTSRRALLAGLSVTPLVSCVPALAAPHPDAAILALCAEHEIAERAYFVAHEAWEEIEVQASAGLPERPDAMRRAGDFRHFHGRSGNPDSPIFYTDDECDRFRGYQPYGLVQKQDLEAAGARAAAIVAAFDAWNEAITRYEAEIGLTAAEERCTQAFSRLLALRERMQTARPTTLDGFVAKARVWGHSRCEKLAKALCLDLTALGASA